MADELEPEGDRYRWCIFCKADCWLDEADQVHAAECPMSTGVWPITEREVRTHMCPACTCEDGGMACDDCHRAFVVGDGYMVVDYHSDVVWEPTVGDRPWWGVVICTGCAAARDLLEEKP